MQLVSQRQSQSWEGLQFNGLPVDFNGKSIARTQVQQLQPQHIFLIASLHLNTAYLNTGSDIALNRFDSLTGSYDYMTSKHIAGILESLLMLDY